MFIYLFIYLINKYMSRKNLFNFCILLLICVMMTGEYLRFRESRGFRQISLKFLLGFSRIILQKLFVILFIIIIIIKYIY